ncbi:nitroreductase family protein [Streptomyces sp. NPDC006733]|uniref:Acg family FMN-binding oxidoreductase n=1 Tax=Streptomyces sp. NPDC006733 TaxID=3155460 RepID=UPI0033D27F9A
MRTRSPALRQLDAVTLEKLISAAIAAPSIHNTQPWRYRLDPVTVTIEVRAAPERSLRHIDPTGRALHLSVGTAVFNLRVAVAHLGWEPVLRLLPDPADPGLLASVRLAGPPRNGAAHRTDLYEAIWRRHTSRQPFSSRPVPEAVRAELSDAAHREGAGLWFPDGREARRLLQLTAEAERRTTGDPARRDESRRWLHRPEAGPVGIPAAALGPQDATGHLPVRDFGAARRPGLLPAQPFEENPVIAVLSTAHDRRADWLRAGQALQHVLLVATAERLSSSLLHQALEWPDLRWPLRDSSGGPSHVQMLLRLGYGPQSAASPRIPAREVLRQNGSGSGV